MSERTNEPMRLYMTIMLNAPSSASKRKFTNFVFIAYLINCIHSSSIFCHFSPLFAPARSVVQLVGIKIHAVFHKIDKSIFYAQTRTSNPEAQPMPMMLGEHWHATSTVCSCEWIYFCMENNIPEWKNKETFQRSIPMNPFCDCRRNQAKRKL